MIGDRFPNGRYALSEHHIGKTAYYRPRHNPGYAEAGTITSSNHAFVFLRYGEGITSAATRYEDLTWLPRDGEVVVDRRPDHLKASGIEARTKG